MSVADREPAEIADEYVLGLLEGDDAREVEARLAIDATLAGLVAKAQERMLAIDETAPSVAPSPELWQRIETAIADGESEATQPTPLPVPRRSFLRRSRSGERSERAPERRLRLAALSGLAASLLLAVALGVTLFLRPEPAVIAALMNDEGELVALVESSPDNRVRVTVVDEVALAGDRVMQVWTKPDPDGPPVSIGIIEQVASQTLSLAGYPPPSEDQLYEITIERAGGSPTGLPTGPILGKGFAREPQ